MPSAPAPSQKPYSSLDPTISPIDRFSVREKQWLATAFTEIDEDPVDLLHSVFFLLSACPAFCSRMNKFMTQTHCKHQGHEERRWLLTYMYHLVQLICEMSNTIEKYQQEPFKKRELSLEYLSMFIDEVIAYWTPKKTINAHEFMLTVSHPKLKRFWPYNRYLALHLMNHFLHSFQSIDETHPIGMEVSLTIAKSDGEHEETKTVYLSEKERNDFFVTSVTDYYFHEVVLPNITIKSTTSPADRLTIGKNKKILRAHCVWNGKELMKFDIY
jgi:hypothetical protein